MGRGFRFKWVGFVYQESRVYIVFFLFQLEPLELVAVTLCPKDLSHRRTVGVLLASRGKTRRTVSLLLQQKQSMGLEPLPTFMVYNVFRCPIRLLKQTWGRENRIFGWAFGPSPFWA